MGNSYPLKIGRKLGDAPTPGYQPDGRVYPGHLTGRQAIVDRHRRIAEILNRKRGLSSAVIGRLQDPACSRICRSTRGEKAAAPGAVTFWQEDQCPPAFKKYSSPSNLLVAATSACMRPFCAGELARLALRNLRPGRARR